MQKITNKKLIILDLNSTLLFRDSKKNVILRPGLYEFLDELISKKYQIAIFTSCKEKNGKLLIDEFFKNYNFEFTWYRDRCDLDPDFGIDTEVKDFDTIKDINSILLSPLLNRKYQESDILFVDDSYRKMRFNPDESYYLIPSYSGEKSDEELTKLSNKL